MSIITRWVAVRVAAQESDARSSNGHLPATEGTPATLPVAGSKRSPGGSVPDEIAHLTVPSAPVATGVRRYATPSVPTDDVRITIVNGDASLASAGEFDGTVAMPVLSPLSAIAASALTR